MVKEQLNCAVLETLTFSTRDTANARRTRLQADYGERLPSLGCELLLRLLPAINSIHPTAWFAFLHTPWNCCLVSEIDVKHALGAVLDSLSFPSTYQAI